MDNYLSITSAVLWNDANLFQALLQENTASSKQEQISSWLQTIHLCRTIFRLVKLYLRTIHFNTRASYTHIPLHFTGIN